MKQKGTKATSAVLLLLSVMPVWLPVSTGVGQAPHTDSGEQCNLSAVRERYILLRSMTTMLIILQCKKGASMIELSNTN